MLSIGRDYSSYSRPTGLQRVPQLICSHDFVYWNTVFSSFLHLRVKKSAFSMEKYGTRIYLDVFTVLRAIIGSNINFRVREEVLPEEFTRKWREEGQTSFYTKIKEAVRPADPLKPRLNYAIRRIELHVERLEKATNRFSERDKSLFARIVKAYQRRDMIRANVFASELTEMRKMEKMVVHARLALEQIALRLRTVSELGDVVSTLAPTVDVLRSVKKGISGIMPGADREFEQIGNLLNGIIIDAGHGDELNINFEAMNDDAQKILNEAATMAEQKIKQELPKIPFEVPTQREKTIAQT